MKKIGITGGIGAGKSYVCGLLAKQGYPVYDCDSRAKRLMIESPAIRQKLRKLLGNECYMPDGSLDKSVISAFLFASVENAEKINSIVHPAVREDFLQWADSQKADTVFMECAILFESGFDTLVDEVWMVTAPLELRVQRTMQRDKTDRESVMQRIALQNSEQYLHRCREIVNDGTRTFSYLPITI